MQNRTYGDVFNLVQSLAGVNTFTSEEQADISRFINRRYFQAYNASQNWVRYLIPSEKRIVNSFSVSGVDTAPSSGTNLNFINSHYYLLGEDSSGYNVYTLSNYVPIDGKSMTSQVAWYYSSSSKKWFLAPMSTISVDSEGVVTIATSAPAYLNQTVADTNVGDSASPEDVSGGFDFGYYSGSFSGYTEITKENLVQFDEMIFESDFSTTLGKTSRQTIGEFLRVHSKKALLSNSSTEFDFYVDANGANILNPVHITGSEVYITYKKTFTAFTTSSDYLTSTESVPEEFFAFLSHSVYADFLRMDGQHQKAIVEENIAKEALDIQLERNDIISNSNNATRKFSTYVNRQSR